MRRPHLIVTLATLTLSAFVAATSSLGEACSQSDSHLAFDTWALNTDCVATTYCADNGTCASRGCRKDIYPYGYNNVEFSKLPHLCPDGQFCPDEGDQCFPQVPVGGKCQKDRDDQCQPPPNSRNLDFYLNSNGSICLNFACYYSNLSITADCIIDNTAYTAYGQSGSAYAFVISRDNCAHESYCDGSTLKCLRTKALGVACTGNKECLSYNCQSSGKCGKAADEPLHPGTYAYILVGLGITGLVLGVMVTLFFTHRKSRKENQIRLEQYYNEQIAYRQSILSMSHAKNSLLSLPPNTTLDLARQSFLAEDAYAYTTASDGPGLLPPNMRRESSAAWSDAGDSDALLMHDSNMQLPQRSRS